MKLKNLEKRRKEKGYTSQGKFASELGLHRITYSHYENGTKPIPSDILIDIAEKLEVSTDYILGRSNCKSVKNDYINKKLGLSDDAINGLRELVKDDEDKVLANFYISNQTGKQYRMFSNLNLHVINVLLTNHSIFKTWISSFVDYVFPFQFRVPVMKNSKGDWKKINSEKNPIALASDADNTDDVMVLPIDNMQKLISSVAKETMDDSVKSLGKEYLQYLLDQGFTDATTLLLNAYSKRI